MIIPNKMMKSRVCSNVFLVVVCVLFAIPSTIGQNNVGSKEKGPFAPSYYPFVQNVDLPSLKTCEHDQLQEQINQMLLRNKKWGQLVKSGNLSIGLVDLQNLNQVRFADVNGDVMMYAASLPKIAILLAAMDALDKNEMYQSEEINTDMWLMINKSDNQASTRMINRLGYDKIEAVLKDPKYNFYDEENGGGLWVGKRYAAGGNRNPDPLQGLSHAATTNQICRFYYMMLQGKLVSQERSQEMMEFMVDPGLHHKFVNSLDRLAPRARIFRKSGSWSTFHSDSVMVWGPNRKFILAALVNDPAGEQILRKLVYEIDEVLKKTKN